MKKYLKNYYKNKTFIESEFFSEFNLIFSPLYSYNDKRQNYLCGFIDFTINKIPYRFRLYIVKKSIIIFGYENFIFEDNLTDDMKTVLHLKRKIEEILIND